jgi:hypothetical protein
MMPTELRGRLNGAQRTRLGSLLNMMYRPSELAEVVGFAVRQVYRVYVPLGCPHEKDERGHLWINGTAFRAWYETVYTRVTLTEDEGYCLTCKRAVKIVNGEEKRKGKLVYIVSVCPVCGRPLSRIQRQEREARD